MRNERGSAMVEAALVFPALVLLLYWSAALTDVLVLKLKAAEAARFSLWETTVFRSGPQIAADVRARFDDLRSPASVNVAQTGLMMYPRAQDVVFGASVNTAAGRVRLSGTSRTTNQTPFWQALLNQLANLLGRSVQTAMERQKFNVFGYAEARAGLVRASHLDSTILNGGDLPGLKGGNDLGRPGFMQNFAIQAPLADENPMRLVFDTWKAWPKPAPFTPDGAPTNVAVSPLQSYPVVEAQVAAQVQQIAFFGLNRQGWFNKLRSAFSKITSAGLSRTLLGGRLPDVFSTDRMDGPRNGPISILPVERPDVAWVPGGGLSTNRLGDVGRQGGVFVARDDKSMAPQGGNGPDRTRYTVPYKINTVYWTDNGGMNPDSSKARVRTPPAKLAQGNDYVKAFQCRGHYFAGSQRGQERDRARRYAPSCNR